MTRFCITGFVPGIGLVQHVIKARSDDDAWARFKRAHGRVDCALVRIAKPRASA